MVWILFPCHDRATVLLLCAHCYRGTFTSTQHGTLKEVAAPIDGVDILPHFSLAFD